MRQRYTLTRSQYDALLEVMRPSPAIMLHIPSSDSQQDRANRAWIALGLELGFDGMTVEPTSEQLIITAEPIPNWVAPPIQFTHEQNVDIAKEFVVSRLNSINNPNDAEAVHGEVDGLILDFLNIAHPEIAEAYRSIQSRTNGWWMA